MMKWNAKIVKVGAEVPGLFKDTKQADFRPADRVTDLEDFSVIYDQRPIGEIQKGDKAEIGDMQFKVVGIGSEANQKLRERGTCTLDFSGKSEPTGTSTIMLSGIGFADKCIREGKKIVVR